MKLLGPDGPHVSDLLKDVDNLDTAKRLADLASENEKSRSKFARHDSAEDALLFTAMDFHSRVFALRFHDRMTT